MKRLKTMIVDDNPAIREALETIVNSLPAEVIAEASNGRSAIEQAQQCSPEMILLDVSMPVMDGFAAARALLRLMPGIRIIMVSQHNSRAYADEALRLGASGYVLKSRAHLDLRVAVDALMNGQTFVSPFMEALQADVECY